MNRLDILLVISYFLQVKTTMQDSFDKTQEIERKYLELIEISGKLINENGNDSSSNYVAILGLINDHHISDKVLEKISTTVVTSPSAVHGLARKAIIFSDNTSEILNEDNFSQIYRRGRMLICATKLYSEDNEFLVEFTKAASYLWTHRFSRMIFIAWVGNELKIYGTRPYHDKTCFSTELVKIGTVKSGEIIKTKPFWARIKDLNQCPLRIITTTGMPYAETFLENNITRVKGIEGNILNILSKVMNFIPLITDTEKMPEFDSSFDDCKDTLRSNESDLCFAGKKINIDLIEPTVTIMDCQKILIVPKAGRIASWMHVIIPFEKSVWISLVFTLSFVAIISLILDEKMASLINIWSLFLGVSIEMRIIKKPGSELLKIFLVVWILFSYVITRSYLAALEGYLTKPDFLPQINTIRELIDSRIPIEGHPIFEKLFCLENETVEELMSGEICNRFKTRSIESIFEDIKLLGKLESAFTMKADIYKNSKFLRDYETHAIKEVLLKYPTAFLAQIGAPFLDEMNIIITHLIEAGFIDLWKRQNVLIKDRKKHYPEKLRVEHVSGILLVTIAGYGISIIVFCLECLINYFHFSIISDSRTLFNYYFNNRIINRMFIGKNK